MEHILIYLKLMTMVSYCSNFTACMGVQCSRHANVWEDYSMRLIMPTYNEVLSTYDVLHVIEFTKLSLTFCVIQIKHERGESGNEAMEFLCSQMQTKVSIEIKAPMTITCLYTRHSHDCSSLKFQHAYNSYRYISPTHLEMQTY